jgi:hypothetical protein
VVACLGSDYEEAYNAKEKFDDEILKRCASRAAGDISNVQAPSSDFFTNLRNSSGTTSLNDETSNQSRVYPLRL